MTMLSKARCWKWPGFLDANGYGRTKIKGKNILVHRMIYELYNGPLPVGICVCHRCDNPSCINPRHLFTGTRVDNNKDRQRKGRYLGEWNGRARLTDDQIREIRVLRDSGLSYGQLAVRFGFSRGGISDICNGKAWTHI